MKKVIAQVRKELAQFRRDKLTVALAVVLPFLSLLLFGYGVRLEIKDIPVVVQNFDSGLMSLDLIDRIYGNDQFIPHKWNGKDVIKDAIDRGYAKAGIIIPPEFSRELRAGHQAKFEAFIDATDVNNARVIKNGIIATTNGFMQSNNLLPHQPPIKPEIRLWFNPGRKESLYVVPGAIAVCLWIYPSLLAALAMVRDKEQGTILQLYASSITAIELIGGKILAYIVIGLGMALFLLTVSLLLFNVYFVGDPTPYILGTIFYVFASVSFGTMIGTRMTTQSSAVQAVAVGGFTTALLLSGYLYPIRNIVFPLNLLCNIVPARWFVQLSRDALLRGGDWGYDWYLPCLVFILGLFYFRVAIKNMGAMQLKA
jgi:ABC-2 type transport system permease protein